MNCFKLLLVTVASFLLFGIDANAQYSGGKDAISFGTVGAWEGFDFSDDGIFDLGEYDYGAFINYSRAFNDYFGLEVPFQIGVADLIRPDEMTRKDDVGYINLGVLARLQYFKSNRQLLVPYVRAGLSGEWSDVQDIRGSVPVGVGFDLRLAHHVYLTSGFDYRIGFDSDNERMNFSAGLKLLIGDGFSDKDKDGVADDVDQCPDIAGVESLMGCPDADGDGVRNGDDSCPNEFGPAENNGCPWPDTDGDGVTDNIDACPDVSGVAALNGCPDADGDGIRDSEDACPRIAGIAAMSGCPDADGDGIMDSEDDCPRIAGPKESKGCPDADGDGVLDKDDRCPRVAGVAALNGCPDTDSDGVIDSEDKCPRIAGPASNNGCPELKEEEKEVIKVAARSIRFETGSSRLLQSSKDILDRVAEVLINNPSQKVDIKGYTDNTGSESTNLKLSKARAKACYEYLLDAGVSASRMTHEGYGIADPIANNATAAGRALNRRVVFEVHN